MFVAKSGLLGVRVLLTQRVEVFVTFNTYQKITFLRRETDSATFDKIECSF